MLGGLLEVWLSRTVVVVGGSRCGAVRAVSAVRNDGAGGWWVVVAVGNVRKTNRSRR